MRIAANGQFVARGLNVVPLTGQDPLDPKGLNGPLSPEEQRRIADTVTKIIAGSPADLQTLDPHAYKNAADPDTGAALPPPTGKYVTSYAREQGEAEGLARIVMDQGGQIFYANNHYRSFYPVDIFHTSE